MFKGDDTKKIGLCQFKTTQPVEKKAAKTIKPASEVKLSDLMRRSYQYPIENLSKMPYNEWVWKL